MAIKVANVKKTIGRPAAVKVRHWFKHLLSAGKVLVFSRDLLDFDTVYWCVRIFSPKMKTANSETMVAHHIAKRCQPRRPRHDLSSQWRPQMSQLGM